MKTWSDDAFAGYVAAMIDGEGSIEIIGDYSVRVHIANTVKHTLDAIIQRLGYGRVREYKRPIDSKYKRLFSIEVSNVKDVGRLFDLCGKYIHMKRDAMGRATEIIRRVLSDVELLDERNRAILLSIGKGETQNHIARRFGVSPQLVSFLKKGHTWKSVMTAQRSRSLKKCFPRNEQQCFRAHK